MPTPTWYEADTDDEDRHVIHTHDDGPESLRDTEAFCASRGRLQDAIGRLEERDELRAEVERLRATVGRVEAVADEFHHDYVHLGCYDEDAEAYHDAEQRLRAALAGGVAADAPTSSDGGVK